LVRGTLQVIKKNLAAPLIGQKWQFGTFCNKKNQQKYSNSELGGTPDTTLRHPGWESLT
jgi:hypothetical protein